MTEKFSKAKRYNLSYKAYSETYLKIVLFDDFKFFYKIGKVGAIHD